MELPRHSGVITHRRPAQAEILDEPGYDEATRLLLVEPPTMPPSLPPRQGRCPGRHLS